MEPFDALNIRYKKLKKEVTKETEENYEKLIGRIDTLCDENRELKECITLLHHTLLNAGLEMSEDFIYKNLIRSLR